MTRTDHRPHRAFSNGVKPIHMLILALVVLFRVTYGGVDMRARRSANEEELSGFQLAGSNLNGQHGQHQPHDPILGGHGDEGHGHGEGHGYQVFHVEFSRVEVPFIIALWIFVSSLAKIGKIFLSFQLLLTRLEAGRPTNKVELYCNSSNAATLD